MRFWPIIVLFTFYLVSSTYANEVTCPDVYNIKASSLTKIYNSYPDWYPKIEWMGENENYYGTPYRWKFIIGQYDSTWKPIEAILSYMNSLEFFQGPIDKGKYIVCYYRFNGFRPYTDYARATVEKV